LHKRILDAVINHAGQSCLAFPSWSHANACVQLIKSQNPTAVAHIEEVVLRLNESSSSRLLYAAIYDTVNLQAALDFWRFTGTGISSRFAESCVKELHTLVTVPAALEPQKNPNDRMLDEEDVHSQTIRQRICGLLQRASLRPDISNRVTPADVYLYPTGMSAIYHCIRMLNSWRLAESVVFGFLYELTPKLLEIYSQSFRFFGLGTEEELSQLEKHLEFEYASGRSIQSIWCECPSNPLLHSVNFIRLRQLANIYGFIIIIDETIGTFANVDLLPVADILVTSLSKSFSGNADVMGGSIVLNPASAFYENLKHIMSTTHVQELFVLDAAVLELNSRLFLPRAAMMNRTAYHLVDLLSSFAALPDSIITKIYHPSKLTSRGNYDPHLRKSTSEFIPSHGALFTIEFESENAASIFFDNLEIHKGPSLGASATLAQPYVQTVFAREKEWAASYGLDETIIRISVGLEDPVSLARAFRRAFSIANWTKSGHGCYHEGICVT
jgi:cystathionine gamma-synthase